MLAVLLVAAAGARADGRSSEPRLQWRDPGDLRAGDAVELRWAGGGADVGELEILLVLDGPRGRTLQVSPQLDPRRGVFVWRVPELGRTVSARLSVRYNRDGHEVEGELGPSLRLLSARDESQPEALAAGAPPGAPEPAGSAARTAAAPGPRPAAPHRDDTYARVRAAQRVVDARRFAMVTTSALAPRSRSASLPEDVPLRN